MKVTFSPGSIKSSIFVSVQFICIGIIIFTGKLMPENIYILSGFIFSVSLAAWSMAVMRFHFNAAPEILPGASLKTKGPYKLIRHPMYTSVLCLILLWVINDFSFIRAGIYLILITDLIIKINYEERLLSEKFENFSEYKRRTKKIVPYIY